ncbi:MAG: ribosome small subunit-dependent GTPase A [Betaproteobacteria bacterium]|nr:ribosome small subunit-dependent GTPase A [Betaproteobacteria bacterium]
MIEIDFAALARAGLKPAVAQLAAAAQVEEGGELHLVRITEVHRDRVRVHDGRDECPARPLPRLERELADEGDALAVGDWVLAAADAYGQAWVRARVPPLTHLARRDGEGRRRTIVSNVDTALVVMGADGDFSPRRAERYLALAQGSGVAGVVVLTKADLVGEREREERVDELRGRLPRGVDVLAVNATDPATAPRLAPYLGAGETLVMLGSSGAGKSTLTNTLLGASVQATGAVRADDSRGRHTTRARSLFLLPQGGCVIDTPGLRSLRPDVDEQRLAASFDDIDSLAARCRYRNCTHGEEPGCAVRDTVDADRLRNYHRLLRDARRDTMTALERQRQVAGWKARSKSVRAWMKARGRV